MEADTANQQEMALTSNIPSETGRKNTVKRSVSRMAGFWFWSNFTAFVSLTIGCFAPGWLTYGDIDYSLWYFTHCDTTHDDIYYSFSSPIKCETMSYRQIRGSTRVHKVLDKADFTQAEALYCTGMILSFATLIKFYQHRQKVARGISDEFRLRKWAFLLILSSLSAVLVFLPVGMFNGGNGGTLPSVTLFSGIVLAGFGGAVMVLTATSMLLCCPALPCSVYKCDDTNEPV
ncbi:uncharacterized protein LOC132756463 [Ruditapes philippinarum]|uniref:uncharacterized protein LOC132756463 n=1 Tax=Ruditapes philippinarum TaxID=129788 RepID=UPI00295A82CD|nr:uncharacterized protein LOC132756463 [Ruditapes philippinarum]